MDLQQKSFELYNTVLRFIVYKVTPNLRRIYLDIDHTSGECTLTGVFTEPPTEIERELFDDIETNSQAHMPDYTVSSTLKLDSSSDQEPQHEFTVFAWYEGE
jgi:hypothetical protein